MSSKFASLAAVDSALEAITQQSGFVAGTAWLNKLRALMLADLQAVEEGRLSPYPSLVDPDMEAGRVVVVRGGLHG